MNIKELKIGIKRTAYVNRIRVYIAECSCGTSGIHKKDYQCQSCKNDYFVTVNSLQRRFVIPLLVAERRDSRGFKIKRTNLSVVWENGMITPVKENLTRTIDYDIPDKRLVIWRGEQIEYSSELSDYNTIYKLDYSNKMFFTQLEENDFLEFASTDATRDMFRATWERFSERSWGNRGSLLKGLIKLFNKYSWVQILSNAGVPSVSRFIQSSYNIDRADNIINTDKTKPHEILGVPKFMMSYIREDLSLDRNILNSMKGYITRLDANRLKEALAIIKDESDLKDFSNSLEKLHQLHTEYGYENFKKLVIYVFRDCRLTQGIDKGTEAVGLLRDYARMSRAMNLEHEKYPKSLKKEHDVAMMNYKLINNGDDKQVEFKIALENKSYKELTYTDKKSDYTIIAPTEYQDLVKEGNQLSHCVSSYVKDVCNERCKIYFLREKEEADKPLVTIEVRGFNIRQARGFANRPVKDEEKQFIKQWAEEKNLVEAYY